MKASSSTNKRKTRNYLIDRDIQLRQSGVFVGLSIVISAIFGIFLYYQTSVYLDVVRHFISPSEMSMSGIDQLDKDLIYYIYWVVLANSLILSAVGIVITHSVAGPMHRLKIQLEKLGKGDYNHVYFRRSDHCHNLEESYNNAVDLLKQKILKTNVSIRNIEDHLEKSFGHLKDKNFSKSLIKEDLNKLYKESQRLKDA